MLEIGRAGERDFSDLFRYSVTGRSFRHPHLGAGTVVKVVDREAQSQTPASASPSSPSEVEDEFARLLSEEGPDEATPAEPSVLPAPDEAIGSDTPEPERDRGLVHFLVLAEEVPEDEAAQTAAENRLPSGGHIEDALRRELGYPLRDDTPVAVQHAGADRDWAIDNVRSFVTETGQAIGLDYADRSLFAVRSRGFRSDKLGRVLLVSVLKRPNAPAPLPSVQLPAADEEEIEQQEAPDEETGVEPVQAVAEPAQAVAETAQTVAETAPVIAEQGPGEELPEVTQIGDLPVLERWHETPISQLPVLSEWEESAGRHADGDG